MLSKSRPRTLAESLRTWDEEALTELLHARPDWAGRRRVLAALAARSTGGSSIGWALDQLDAWRRVVAEALAALPDPSSTADVAELLGHPQSSVKRAVRDLRARALVWGDDDRLHLVRPVREAFEPYPGGLAPPSGRPLLPAQIDRAVAECSAEARRYWSGCCGRRRARFARPTGWSPPPRHDPRRGAARPELLRP